LATDQEVLGSTPSRRTKKEENENIFTKICNIFLLFSIYNINIDNNIHLMSKNFKQLSIKPGFMKHNGGLLFRKISKNEYEFKTKINKNHLNMAGITHGGYIASIIDSGAGTGAHKSTGGKPCVTISLDIKFIASTVLGNEIIGFTKIQKITNSMVFLICHLKCKGKLIATASGIWKILKKSLPNAGYGG
jgi:uncharacterized protein (TIGR00369 family)|tara:strand:+ start:152 stop:721 length:570 start_codon:yes stop_codon:yes gene_type:complete